MIAPFGHPSHSVSPQQEGETLVTARTRVVALSALFALLLTMSLVASSRLATVHGELLSNGDLESGFAYREGCGMVGESS
jgi:hypothetical protein